jgi:hypothetical protein
LKTNAFKRSGCYGTLKNDILNQDNFLNDWNKITSIYHLLSVTEVINCIRVEKLDKERGLGQLIIIYRDILKIVLFLLAIVLICLFFFDLRILVTPLVSSNSFYGYFQLRCMGYKRSHGHCHYASHFLCTPIEQICLWRTLPMFKWHQDRQSLRKERLSISSFLMPTDLKSLWRQYPRWLL